MPDILKNKLLNSLDTLVQKSVNAYREDNTDMLLCDMFVWQELAAAATKNLKKAQQSLDKSELVPEDDALRTYEVGDHTIETSGHFAFTVKVSEPRALFDKDAFVVLAVKKLKVKKSVIRDLLEASTSESKAPLSKRVVEL